MKEAFNQFYETVIGNASIGEWIAAMFLAVLVQGGMLLMRAKKRDVASERTPEEWSWKFFWRDTARQIIGTLILIFVFIRVLQYIVAPKYFVASALAVGLCSDLLVFFALKIKNKIAKGASNRIDNNSI